MKTICITGATSGIGRATAERFARDGARLILCGRRKERLEEVCEEIEALYHPTVHSMQTSRQSTLNPHTSGGERGEENLVYAAPLDVTDKQAVQDFLEHLPEAFRAIDVLVNNAGGALGMRPAHEASLDDWEQMVNANIKGLLYCTHAILSQMVKRDSGHIINIGSIAGEYPYPGGNVYGGTKAFVKQFSLNLRADLLGKNIRVTVIEPGMTETEFSLVRFHGDIQKAEAVYAGLQPLSAEDIAESIHWCVSAPAHVNINTLELMPTMQAFSPFAVKRQE